MIATMRALNYMGQPKLLLAAVITSMLSAVGASYSDAPKFVCPQDQTAEGKVQAGQTNQMPVDYWGLPGTRWVGRFDGDDFPDFCRLVKSNSKVKGGRLRGACSIAVGSDFGDMHRGITYCTDEISNIKTLRPVWTDVTGDGQGDLCTNDTVKIEKKVLEWARCYPGATRGFGSEVRSMPYSPSFAADGWGWVDFNGDGKYDFCYLHGKPKGLTGKPTGGLVDFSCLISDGKQFAKTVSGQTLVENPSLIDWIDINGDKKIDFCTVVGPKKDLIKCLLSDGTNFKAEAVDVFQP
jgi:hypothetical protein